MMWLKSDQNTHIKHTWANTRHLWANFIFHLRIMCELHVTLTVSVPLRSFTLKIQVLFFLKTNMNKLSHPNVHLYKDINIFSLYNFKLRSNFVVLEMRLNIFIVHILNKQFWEHFHGAQKGRLDRNSLLLLSVCFWGGSRCFSHTYTHILTQALHKAQTSNPLLTLRWSLFAQK